MKFVMRHDVRRTDDYWFEIDEYKDAGGRQMLLTHLQFLNWSPGVLKRGIRDFKIFREHVTAPLYACAPPWMDPKWVKFMKLVGYRFHQDVICDDGITRPLYIHTI